MILIYIYIIFFREAFFEKKKIYIFLKKNYKFIYLNKFIDILYNIKLFFVSKKCPPSLPEKIYTMTHKKYINQ
jgi:hypothetical protein